jgi:hypothetical protein
MNPTINAAEGAPREGRKTQHCLHTHGQAGLCGLTSRTSTRRTTCSRDVVQVEGKARTGAWIAVAALLLLQLAGCAAELGPKPSGSAAEAAPYVGVFTGEFVDGKPLYRFPPMYVIGLRSSVGPDISGTKADTQQ